MPLSEFKLMSFLCVSSSCGSLSADLLGPLIIGPSISVDDWVPERPPKKPHLRAAFPLPLPERLPSPDLPPPSPPTVLEDEVFASDEPLPPPPPELNSPDKISMSESHGERTPSPQKHLSQNISSVQRHQDSITQRNVESISDRSPENVSPFQSDSEAQRHVENSASSPQKLPGSSIQRHLDNLPSPQSSSETNVPRVSVACNALSIRHVDDSTQKDSSATVQQKYHKNSSSPESTHMQQRQMENGISSQRYLERGISLSRHIEDCVVPQKRVESISTFQRHTEHNNVTQRHRECAVIQKHVINSNSVQGSVGNEITLQRYHQNGSSQRPLESGTVSQKQAESGNATVKQADSVTLTQRSIDTVSITRNISSAALNRRQECGAVSNSHVASSSSHQGYVVMLPAYRNMNDTFARTSAIKPLESNTCSSAGVLLSRHPEKSRSSLRYPTQKLMVNGKLATPVLEQVKKQDGPPDMLRVADRNALRNEEVQVPLKTRLQNVLTAVSNGEGNVPEDPPRASRSPPHTKRENGLMESQQQLEGTDREIKASTPPAVVITEGHTNDSQCINQTDQKNQDPPAPVTRLDTHSQT